MFEISRNDALLFECYQKQRQAYTPGTYDFTFENRFLVYHTPLRKQITYIVIDKNTGLGAEMCSHKSRIYAEEEFPELVPRILAAIQYIGDHRIHERFEFDDEKLIDQIFRVMLPQCGFRVREEQIRLAKLIYHGFRDQRSVSICEAEVGTGKTMAYLVAAYCEKCRREEEEVTRRPITIVTSSIELQTSIMGKEIPLLSRVLERMYLIDEPLRAVLRKGKEHYFCLARYKDYINMLSGAQRDYSKLLQYFRDSKFEDWAFDLDKIKLPGVVKQSICVKGNCSRCRWQNFCRYNFFMDIALDDEGVDIQVVNHNLYLMAQKQSNLLQDSEVVVIDEAHKLKDAAQDVYGSQFGEYRVQKFLNWSRNRCQDQSRKQMFINYYLTVERLNGELFAQLRRLGNLEGKNAEDYQPLDGLPLKVVCIIKDLEEAIRMVDELAIHDRDRAQIRVPELCKSLLSFMHTATRTIWVSIEENGETCLHSCPKNLGKVMHQYLWDSGASYALLSGTMSDGSSFGFFKRENGLELLEAKEIQEVSIQSPYDFEHHTRLYISNDMPLPDYDDPSYFQAVADRVVELIRATNGHTAILFTSYQMLHSIYELTRERLEHYEVICMGRSNKTAISEFKKSKNGVLFASGSMWEGVDCAGDVLSSVIIVRLPFPLRTAAMEAKKNNCRSVRDFVQEYAVPEMLIKLRQGAGRLIRGETDTGVLSILDGRAAEGSAYREQILQAFCKYPLVTSVQAVAEFIDEVKDQTYKRS